MPGTQYACSWPTEDARVLRTEASENLAETGAAAC